MDDIRQWTLSVCVCALLSGAILTLFPSGSMKRTGKLVCVMLTGLSFLLPLGKNGGFDLSVPPIDFPDTGAYRKEIDERVLAYVESQLTDELIASADNGRLTRENVRLILDARSVSDVRVEKIVITAELDEKEKERIGAVCRELFTREVTVAFEREAE